MTQAGVLDAAADADWLACALLSCERGDLFLKGAQPVDAETAARYDDYIARRASGEPIGRILKKAWFMGLAFEVPDQVLIPRSDTETLCEQALLTARETGAHTALDLCTGSGVLAVCLAKLGGLAVTASDLSLPCVQAAARNAAVHGAAVRVLQGDLFEPVQGERFDLIVCNPPYIPNGLPLMREVADFDPPLALFAGADGLDFYRRLAQEAPQYLNCGASLLLEFGVGQQEAIFGLFARPMQFFNDLNGVHPIGRAARAV